jgi:hypothetical protein
MWHDSIRLAVDPPPQEHDRSAIRRTAELVDGANIDSLASAVRVFFSFPGPRYLAASALAASTARALLGPPGVSDIVTCAGIAVYWPLQEWAVHKYLLHVKPRPGFDPWFARVHREHHRTPSDVELTLLPPRILRAAIPTNVALWLLLAPGKRVALTGIAASSLMALFYEWCHFLVHTHYKPDSGWLQHVRKNHRLHHFYNENYWFGFTSTLVDTVLRTDPDIREVPRSSTVRDLHGLFAGEQA